jgi:hypothetical protein
MAFAGRLWWCALLWSRAARCVEDEHWGSLACLTGNRPRAHCTASQHLCLDTQCIQVLSGFLAGAAALTMGAQGAQALTPVDVFDDRKVKATGFDLIYEARDLDLDQRTRDGMTQARKSLDETKKRVKASEARIDAELEPFIKKAYWCVIWGRNWKKDGAKSDCTWWLDTCEGTVHEQADFILVFDHNNAGFSTVEAVPFLEKNLSSLLMFFLSLYSRRLQALLPASKAVA